MTKHLAVVVPVYRNGATLSALAGRLDAAIAPTGGTWTLRLVVDACPDGSAVDAVQLAAADPRVHVTLLDDNVGQHRALAIGLAAEPVADAWACLDGDLQDPPEALPELLDALYAGGHDAVFAGRRGSYERRGRQLTGHVHRKVLAGIAGLPGDAGAFLVMRRAVRDRVVERVLFAGAPSVVLASASPGASLTSIPVERHVRTDGSSAWTSLARVRQSVATIFWAARERRFGRQVLGFAVIGVVGTLAYLAAYAVLRTVLPAHPANVVARLGTAIPTTWANGRYTFGSRQPIRRVAIGGVTALCLGILITSVPLAAEQALLGHHDRLAELLTLAVATVVATAARFVFLRRWFTRGAGTNPRPEPPVVVPPLAV